MTDCVDHLNFIGQLCPDCGLEVDAYGNTESLLRGLYMHQWPIVPGNFPKCKRCQRSVEDGE